MSMRKKVLPRNTSIAPRTTTNQWNSFLIRHVKVNSLVVSKALAGRDMEEARELVLEYLDGFLVWLNDPDLVDHFKQSYYISTTYIDTGDPLSDTQEVDLDEVADGDAPSLWTPNKKLRHDLRYFRLSVSRPKSCHEARKNLESYLVLWRTVYSVCESAAHAPNRLAQLFDFEVSHTGPLFKLSRLLAYPSEPFSEDGYLSNVDQVAFPSMDAHGSILVSDTDISDFYQGGIKEIEGRRFNFDDLNECCNFRIKASNCTPPPEGSFLPRIKGEWIRKTFKEPEGSWAFIVALRQYYPILVYNFYLTLGAWAWFERGDIDIQWVLLADGIAATIGMLLEIASKWKVFTIRSYFMDNLPFWALVFQVVLWIIGLGEVGLWAIVTKFGVFNATWKRWIPIIAFAGAMVARLIHNIIYYFHFPAIKHGHHKYRTTTLGMQGRLFFRSGFFFVVITGMLVPLYFWFVVPTLKRSAPWSFCPNDQMTIQIQCWIGVIGLWIPLISIILIMDFIAYIIVMSFYGLSLAASKHIGGTNEAAHSMIQGFRSFSMLIRKWTHTVPPPAGSKHPSGSSVSLTTDSSSPSGQSSVAAEEPTPKKGKGRKGKKNVKIGKNIEVIADSSAADKDHGRTRSASNSDHQGHGSQDGVNYSESSDDEDVKERVGDVHTTDVGDDIEMAVMNTSTGPKQRRGSGKRPKGKRPSGDIVLDEEEQQMYQVKIRMNPLADLSQVEHEMEAVRSLWYLIVDDLMNQDMISKESARALYVALNYQDIPLGSKPKDIIRFFFSSLYAMAADKDLDELPPNYLEKMPSMTQLIPSYGEAVVFETGYLCNRDSKKVTNLEFLVLKYPKQWGHFYARMKVAYKGGSHCCYGTANPGHAHARRRDPFHGLDKYRFPATSDDMLLWFLQLGTRKDEDSVGSTTMMHPDLINEIRLWASLRGQTLYKTLRGSLTYRMALRAMYACTKHDQAQVHTKCQVILAHQMYGDPSMLRQVAGDLLLIYKQLSMPNIIGPLFGDTPFDLVFDWSPRALQVQHAFLDRLAAEKNEEYIRRYTLSNIYTETEDICAHGEALKRLIDAKAGDCPISTTEGFPYASVIAGLPTPSRLQGRAWLFKFKGRAAQEFNNHAKSAHQQSSNDPELGQDEGMDPFMELASESEQHFEEEDEEDEEDNAPFARFGLQKPSHWIHLASGDTVLHNCTRTKAINDAIAWLRCFNEDSGREFDFLIHRETFDVHPVTFFTISSAQSAMAEVPEDDANKSGRSDHEPHERVYAVIKFGIRHAWVTSRFDMYAIVTCINEDQFARFQSDGQNEGFVISEAEGRRLQEANSIASNLSVGASDFVPNQASFSAVGKEATNTLFRFHSGLQAAATSNAFMQMQSLHPRTTDVFLGIEVRAVLPRRNELILRVAPELPIGDPDRIQGKSANQMNGLRFAFGLITQTKDANQGGNVTEAMKYPIVLRNFLIHNARDRGDQARHLKHWLKRNDKKSQAYDIWQATDTYLNPREAKVPVELIERSVPVEDAYERDNWSLLVPPAIQGFREAIFTRSQGTVARFQAYSEWTFGTLVQRVYSKLNIRMHYGHPDFFSSAWVYSRLMSKANPTYNLSEDIFAGYFAMLNGRRSSHTDKIQDEKGRDTSLSSTAIFTAKLAQGAASQMKSRDVFNLNTRLDFMRLFFVFHSSLGYYFTTTTMLLSVKAYLFAFIVFSLAGYSASNLSNLSFVYSMPFLVQVGMATLLPLFLEVGREEGVLSLLKLLADLPLSLGYYLFQGQTTTHHMLESFLKGKSHYEPTGRLLGISRKSLVDIYQLFGQSHIEPALDYLFYIIIYYIIASTRHGGFMPLFGPIICVIVFIIAPTGFQIAHSYGGIFTDIGDFGRWMLRTESFNSLLKEWKSTPMREQMIKNLTWKTNFQTKHSRLQTYIIFRTLKSAMTTHWRVDLAAAILNGFRVALWGFIIISVPGGMKDSILKIVLALALYVLVAMGISTVTPHDKKGCWYSVSVVLFVLSMAYFIAMFIILNIWRYIGESIIGIFVALKLLKSLSWAMFYFYSVAKKIFASNHWRLIDYTLRRGKISIPDRDKATKLVKAELEKNLLAGLFLVDCVDRPVMIFFLSFAYIPIHIVWNLFWSIPYMSHYIMYAVKLKPKKGYKEMISRPAAFAAWNMGSGFNVPVDQQVNDLDELPQFNFDGDVDFYF